MAASSPAILRSPYKLAAVGALALTAATTVLTWTSRDGVDSWGLAHDDGFVVILATVIGIVLVTKGIKAAWIAPGFVVVLLIRDISRVRGTDFDVGLGLWLGTGFALLAAVLLIGDIFLNIQGAARSEQDS
ncbi:MAG: hypothetical protein OER95_01705 [Acidimicrobiia bacterium]|nr:hypothetical protein [Acidimicrobiia bacterium]